MTTHLEDIVKSEISPLFVGHSVNLCSHLCECCVPLVRNPCSVSSVNICFQRENIILSVIISMQAADRYRLLTETCVWLKDIIWMKITKLLLSWSSYVPSWNSKLMLSFLFMRLWSSWLRQHVNAMLLSRAQWILKYTQYNLARKGTCWSGTVCAFLSKGEIIID